MKEGTARHTLARGARAERLMLELLAGHPVGEAAKRAGIPRRSAVRIRKDPEFQRMFSQARGELLQGAVSQLHSAAAGAVFTLAAVAGDAKARKHDRVSAARFLLDALYRGVEVADFGERIARLESTAKGA